MENGRGRERDREEAIVLVKVKLGEDKVGSNEHCVNGGRATSVTSGTMGMRNGKATKRS